MRTRSSPSGSPRQQRRPLCRRCGPAPFIGRGNARLPRLCAFREPVAAVAVVADAAWLHARTPRILLVEHGCICVLRAKTMSSYIRFSAPAATPTAAGTGSGRPTGNATTGEAALLAGLVAEMTRRYSCDPRRVYVAGLSAGGAMAVTLGRVYPDVFGAVGVHSGLPHACAHDVPSALAAMRKGAKQASPTATGEGTQRSRADDCLPRRSRPHGEHPQCNAGRG